ncbi:PKD domain-containing protein [Halosegnis rubeus]|uniref:PKD domain-containing protein n=1 Tax=Halosegnis rubeus TaxID=2212850 RepID=A0A5N5U7Y6_9EURY|nr:PKD domain-containing protein [Halosegnis rubeus]KAB7514735.1 PKD domain-containing protein [Halosegnis rubeus]
MDERSSAPETDCEAAPVRAVVGVTRTAGRLLAVYLVGLVGLAMLVTGTGVVGVASAAGNTAPDCSTVSYNDGDSDGKLDVDTIDRLQCIENEGVGKEYELTDNIDASGTSNWNGGDGFAPIGDSGTKFTGTFDGNGHTITGLYVDRSGSDDVGLFGYAGSGTTVENVGLESVDVTGANSVGALVGTTEGTVRESHATGPVSGDENVGGLVGENLDGRVTRSYATGNVIGTGRAGGLVGWTRNGGTVAESYATGTVDGDVAGSLVGETNFQVSVRDSYATGSTSGNTYEGGLAGYSYETDWSDSYWDKGTTNQGSAFGYSGSNTRTNLQGFGSTGDSSPAPEMQGSSASSNMGGFDFTNTWETVESGDADTTGDGYPILQSVDRQAQLDAQNVNAYAGGDGSDGDPYEIANWHHLDNVRQNLGGDFVLTADLNSGTAGYSSVASSSANSNNGFEPIGDSSTGFTGTFDGDGYEVSGLTIDRASTSQVGVFGYIGSSGLVRGVIFTSVTITGSDQTGGIVGRNAGGDIVETRVTGSVSGDRYTGGVVGLSSGVVRRTGSTANVSGSGNQAGGLVGENRNLIEQSYAKGSVSGSFDVGGLVGKNDNGANVKNSFATGSVSGTSTLGGLVGNNAGSVSNSYWDADVNGNGQDSDSTGSFDATSLITTQMQRFAPQVNMGNLDFDSVWVVTTDYPRLAWEGATALTVDSVEATSPTVAEDGSGTITVTAKESGTDAGEGVTIEIVDDDGLDGFATSDTRVTDTDGEATFTFDEPDDGTYTPEFAWADDTTVSAEPTVTVQNAPEVTAIERSSGESNPTNADSVEFVVRFSEGVSGVDTGDFTATGVSGDASGDVSQVTSVAVNAVTVTVGSISGDGDIRLDLDDDDGITNGNGVPLGGDGTSGTADGSYASGETFTVDNTDPGFSAGTSNSVSVDEESTASDFLDVDAGDDGPPGTEVSAYTLSSAASSDASVFSIDSSTGKLSLDSALDHESPADDDGNNDYELTVTATDDVGNTNTQTVTVGVTDVDEPPTAPDDSSQSTDEDTTVSVADGDSADLLVLASDPDAGDTLSLDTVDGSSFSDGNPVTLDSGATVTVESDGGWTYDPNGQYESLASGDSTTDTFTYTVADSDDDTAQGTVTVSITGVNDDPTDISLTSTSVDQSDGTDAVVGSLSATDVDDSSHTFSLVGGTGDADNDEFNIGGGDLRADDAGSLTEGDYDVRLEADDGSGGTYQKAVTVSVTDGIAPTIASSTPADDATGVSEGDDITITFSEDIAFGSGSVTLREDDGGFGDREAFDVSSDTGSGDGTVSISGRTLTITPTSNFASDTEYAVRIDAGALTDTASSPNDFGGISDDTTLSFTTTDSTPPTASAGPDTTIDEGQSVSFDGTGSMDNVGIVSYDWDFDDDGTTATGQTTSHTFDSPGTYTVELTVTDAAGNTDTDTVEVTVESASSDGGSSSGSSGSTDTGGDQSTADDSSIGTETVVSGTQSSDASVSFTVNASDDDGPITLDLSETDADGTDGEDESGGNDDSEGEGENTVSVDSLSITPTESGSREFDISVREWDADIDTSERATESDDTGTDTTDVSDPQGATDGDRAHTDPRTFLIETGLSPLGYVEVTHTNPDSDIDSVTFRFRIRKDALNQSNVDPSGVALYRNGTDGLTRLPTDEIGENSTHYVFEGTSPGLSLFTIASAQPAFEVIRASSRSETLTTSEAVTVNATVRNLGGAAGTYTAELRANGTVVATSDVDFAPNSSRTVSLSFTPSDPGGYTLTVGTVSAGAVSVQSDETPAESTSADQTLTEPTPAEQETTQQTTVATDNSSQTASANGTRETTTDASGPGFGVLVLIGAFLIVIVFFRRRS